MLGGNVVVLHAFGIAFGRVQRIHGALRQAHLSACPGDPGAAVQVFHQFFAQRLHTAGHARDHGRGHAFVLAQQRQQQVGRFNGLVVQIAGQLLGGKHSLARLLGKFFKIHIPS